MTKSPGMDPKHAGDILKHLEKQDELLMEAYRSMSHELHKLQVEEEMLMRKFYEIMSAHDLTKKTHENGHNGETNALTIANTESTLDERR